MIKDEVTKIRAWFLFGLALLTYPVTLTFALIYKLFSLFGNTKCKSVAGDVALVRTYVTYF